MEEFVTLHQIPSQKNIAFTVEVVMWHHFPMESNAAELRSREGNALDSHLWKHGSNLAAGDLSNWPPEIQQNLQLKPWQKLK